MSDLSERIKGRFAEAVSDTMARGLSGGSPCVIKVLDEPEMPVELIMEELED